MRDIRIAAAQFEHRDGDKAYNLGRIRELARPGGRREGPRSSASTSAASRPTPSSRRSPATSSTPLAEPVPDGPVGPRP